MSKRATFHLFTTDNLGKGEVKSCEYPVDVTGAQLLKLASNYLSIDYNTSNTVNFLDKDGLTKEIKPDETVSSQGVKEGNTILITINPEADERQFTSTQLQKYGINLFDSISGFQTTYGEVDFSALGIEIDDKPKDSIEIYVFNEFDTIKDSQTPCFFSLKKSFKDTVKTALNHLGIERNRSREYALLLSFSEDEKKWFEKENYLEDYNPYPGMAIHVFKRRYPIEFTFRCLGKKIKNKIKVDIMKTVSELVTDVAPTMNIESTFGFSFYTHGKTPSPLDLGLSLPMQTYSFDKLIIKRRFLVFTKQDFSSLLSAHIAFHDCEREIRNGSVYLDEDAAVKLAVYGSIVKSKPGEKPKVTSKGLPKSYEAPSDIDAKVREFISSQPMPDLLNSIREYIRIARQQPGFGMQKFKCDYIFTEKQKTYKMPGELLLFPQKMIFIQSEKNPPEFELFYQKIQSISMDGNKIMIKHRAEVRFMETITLRSNENTKEIFSLIQQSSDVMKSILRARALMKAEKTGNETVSIEDQIGLYTTDNRLEPNPKLILYSRSSNGSQILERALNQLGIAPCDDYKLLLKISDDSYRWIEPRNMLANFNPDDGMTLYIIHSIAIIKILFTDGSSKTLKLDVSKPIYSIATEIFAKIHAPEIVGYTLYIIDGKDYKPLDSRFTIPEQAVKYDTLLFKRRFLLVNREDITEQSNMYQTYNDVHDNVINGQCEITEEQMFQLAVYSLNMLHPNVESIKTIKIDNFSELFPKSVKVTSKLKDKFIKFVQTSKPKYETWVAIKNYIGIARELPLFGAELFKCSYVDESKLSKDKKIKKKKLPEGYFAVCPLNVVLLDLNKQVVFKASYTRIISYRASTETLRLMMSLGQGKPGISYYTIMSPQLEQLILVMSQTIDIFRKLIIERQLKDAAMELEIQQKLAGGWIDKKGIVRKPMIDVYLTRALNKVSERGTFWFEVHLTKDDLMKEIRESIPSIDKNKAYSILALKGGSQYSWIRGKETLGSVRAVRKTVLFILESKPLIRVCSNIGLTKGILLEIENPINVLLPTVLAKLELTRCLGYTLYQYNKTTKILNIMRTIPEQVLYYDNLNLKRRFFFVTDQDFANIQAISMLFNDLYDHVLTGQMDIKYEEAFKLAIYGLHGKNPLPEKLTSKEIPSDIQPLLPKGISTKLNALSKFKKMFEQFTINNKEDAYRKYIEFAQTIQTFGCYRFPIQMDEVRKGKKVSISGFILVGPLHLFIVSNDMRYLLIIPYIRLICIEGPILDKFAIKYIDSNKHSVFFDCESSVSKEIIEVIEGYSQLSIDYFHLRRSMLPENNRLNDVREKFEIETYLEFNDMDYGFRFTYNLMMTGEELAKAAANYLKQKSIGQYLCLLQYTDDHSRWVSSEKYLGEMNPYPGIILRLFKKFKLVNIFTSDGTVKKMVINITLPVNKIVSDIAYRLYIDHWLGYTLYYENKQGNLIHLDLELTIPEQTSQLDTFVFKRRTFVNTKYDLKSVDVLKCLYNDYKSCVMNSEVKLNEPQLIGLALYQTYADAFINGEKPYLNPKIHDVFPTSSKVTKKTLDDLKLLLKRTPEINGEKAVLRYIENIQNMEDFGCELFQGEMIPPKAENKKKKQALPAQIIMSIGPKGIRIMKYPSKVIISDIGYSSIVSFKTMRNLLELNLSDSNGTAQDLHMAMKSGITNISRLIHSYLHYYSKKLKRRNIQQQINLENEKEVDIETIEINTSRQIDHPSPPKYCFRITDRGEKIVQLLTNFFLLKNKDDYYSILYRSNLVEFHWVENDKELCEYNPTPYGHIILLKSIPYAYIITEYDNVIMEEMIDLRKTIETNVYSIMYKLNLKFPEGYTFYSISPDKYHPLDLDFPLLQQTAYFRELVMRRRFYIFSQFFFEDKDSLMFLYYDCKEMILSGQVKPSDDQILRFAILSVYAEDDAGPSLFQDLSPLLPRNMNSNSTLIHKFKILAKVVAPMPSHVAAFKYIQKIIPMQNYGTEYHMVLWTDLISKSKKSKKISGIFLGPFGIQVRELSSKKLFNEIDYLMIISYSCVNNEAIEIKYHDQENLLHDIYLESEEYYEIFSYIKTMIRLLSNSNNITSPDMMLRTIQRTIDNVKDFIDTDPEFNDLYTFDDNDLSFTDLQTLLDTKIDMDDSGDYSEFQYDMMSETGEITESPEQLTEEGLNFNRANELFDDMENILNGINEGMTPEQYNKEIDKVHIIMNQFQNLNLSDKIKGMIRSLGSTLDQLRDIGFVMNPKALTLNDFMGDINDKIKEALNQIKQIKINIGNMLDKLRDLLNDDESNNPQVNKNHKGIAGDLMNLLRMNENMMKEMMKNIDKLIKNGEDPQKWLAKLKSISAELMNLANMLLNNDDISAVQKAMPRLLQIGDFLSNFEDMLIKCGISQDSDLMKQLNAMKDLLKHIIDSCAKYGNGKVNGGQLYNGDIEATIKAASEILCMIGHLNGLLGFDSIKANNAACASIKSTLGFLGPEAKQIVMQVVALKKNHDNTIARDDALYRMLNAKHALEAMKIQLNSQKLNDPLVQKSLIDLNEHIKNLGNLLASVSPANIVPKRTADVLEDLSLLISKETTISPKDLSKLSNKESDLIKRIMEMLFGSRNDLDVLHKQLEANPTDAKTLKDVQDLLLNLKCNLSGIQEMINSLQRVTDDETYPVIFERLNIDLDAALCEIEPVEPFKSTPHIVAFHNAQQKLASLISLSNKMAVSPVVIRDDGLSRKLEHQIKRMNQQYLNMADARSLIHQKPFSENLLDKVMKLLNSGKQILKSMKNPAMLIAERASDMRLDIENNTTIIAFDEAIEAFNNAPHNVFRLPPNEKDIKKLIQSVKKVMERIQTEEPSEKSKENIDFFTRQLLALEDQLKMPTMEFYKIASKIGKKNSNLPVSLKEYPSLLDDPVFTKAMKDLDDLIKMILKPPHVTLDIAKMIAKMTIPSIEAFKLHMKNSLSLPEVKSVDLAVSTFTGWDSYLDQIIKMLKDLINKKPFDYPTAYSIKDILSDFLKKMPNIPPAIRLSLDQNIGEQMSIKLGEALSAASYAINCIRSLPTISTISMDHHMFTKFMDDVEIEDGVALLNQQINAFAEALKSADNVPQISTRPNTRKMLQNMIKLVDKVSFSADDEKELLESIKNFKNSYTAVIGSSGLIASNIGLKNLPACANMIGSNVNTLARLLTSIKLNAKNSVEFRKLITPLLEQLLKDYKEIKIQSLPSNIQQLLDEFMKKTEIGLKDLPTMRPGKMQHFCDYLYGSLTNLLPSIMDVNDIQSLINDMFLIYDTTGKWTTLPEIDIRYSNGLILKKNILTDETIEHVMELTVRYLDDLIDESSIEYRESIQDCLSVINEHQESVPVSIYFGSSIILPCLIAPKAPFINGSIIIASMHSKLEQRMNYYKMFIVKTAVKAALMLESTRNIIKYVEEQIIMTNETKYYLELLKMSMNTIDTNLLTQCQSLSITILAFQDLHEIKSKMAMLIDSIKTNHSIRSLIQPLIETSDEYFKWLDLHDLSLATYFLASMDRIVIESESLLLKDINHKLPQNLSIFVKKMSTLLKYNERYLIANDNLLYIASNMFFEFEKYNVLTELVQKLEEIRPIITIWSKPVDNLDKNGLRLALSSDIIISQNAINSILVSKISPQDLRMRMLLPYSMSTSISNVSTNAKINAMIQPAQNLVNSIVELYKPEFQFEKAFKEIIQTLNFLLNEAMKLSEIDFNKLPEIDFEFIANRANDLLSTISDKNCLASAKAAIEYLKHLIQVLKTLPKEDKQAIIQRKSYMFVPIQSIGHLSVLKIENMEDFISSANKSFEVTDFELNGHLSVQSFSTMIISQIFNLLNQAQLAELPHVVHLTNTNQDLDEDTIDESFYNIKRQIDDFSSNKKLKTTINQFNQHEILKQQFVINSGDFVLQNTKNYSHLQQFKSTLIKEEINIIDELINSDTKTADFLNCTKIISCHASFIRVLSRLLELQINLTKLDSNLFKFAQSNEGQQLFKSPISLNEISVLQIKIIQEYNENIMSHQITSEEIIKQLRVIQNFILLLVNYKHYMFTESDPIELLKTVSMDQQKLNQENPSYLRLSSIINTSLSKKAQSILVSTFARYNLMVNLLIQFQQINVKPAAFHQSCLVARDTLISLLPDFKLTNVPQNKRSEYSSLVFHLLSQLASTQSTNIPINIDLSVLIDPAIDFLRNSIKFSTVKPNMYSSFIKLNSCIQTELHLINAVTMKNMLTFQPNSCTTSLASTKDLFDVYSAIDQIVISLSNKPEKLGQLVQSLDDNNLKASSAIISRELVLLNQIKNERIDDITTQAELFYRATMLQMQKGHKFSESIRNKQEFETLKQEVSKEISLLRLKYHLSILLQSILEFVSFDFTSGYIIEVKDLESAQNSIKCHLENANFSKIKKDQLIIEMYVIQDAITNMNSSIEEIFESQKGRVEEINQLHLASPYEQSRSIYLELQRNNMLYNMIELSVQLNSLGCSYDTSQVDCYQYHDIIKFIYPFMLNEKQLTSMINEEERKHILNITNDIVTILQDNQIYEKELVNILPRSTQQVPSERQMVTMLAQSVSTLIKSFPIISKIPISECNKFIQSENTATLSLLKKLDTSRYTPETTGFIEFIPILICSMSRVIPQLDAKVQKLIVNDPIKILPVLEKLLRSSVTNQPVEYRKTIIELMSTLSDIDAATNDHDIKKINKKIIQALANLANSISNNDLEKMLESMISFNSIKVKATAQGEKVDFIAPIANMITSISPAIQDSFSSNQPLPPQVSIKVQDLHKALIELINSYSKNPFVEVEKLKTKSDVIETLKETKTDFELQKSKLIKSTKNKISPINSLIKSVCDAQAAVIKNFEISKCKSSTVLLDFINMNEATTAAINNLMNLASSSSVSEVTINRATRYFNRMINSLQDLVDSSDEWNEETNSELEKTQLDHLKKQSILLQKMMLSTSTHSSSLIPESFNTIVEIELPNIDITTQTIKTTSEALLKLNKDKSIALDFELNLSQLLEQIDKFKSSASSYDNDIISELYRISKLVSRTSNSCMRLTDSFIPVPDVENADRVPLSFRMPHVPKDIVGLKVQKAHEGLLQNYEQYKQIEAKFFEIGESNNEKSVDIMLEMNCKMTELVQSILSVTATTMNLDIRTDLASSASSTVSSFDQLLKAIRSKLLLRGDWEMDSQRIFSSLSQSLESAISNSKKAFEIAKEEERTSNKITTLFMEFIQPVQQAIEKLETTKNKVSEMQSSISKEWNSQMIEIGIALSNATFRLLLYSKDHYSTNQQTKDLFDFAKSIANEMDSIIQAAISPSSSLETDVSQIMNRLNDLCKMFLKSKDISESPFKESISSIRKGIESLKSMAETSIQNKQKATNIIPTINSKEKLLKRLELEANVIRARIILERSEKELNLILSNDFK